MRYYDIFIPNAPAVFNRTPNGAIWSSHPLGNDTADPGAQQIEFNFIEIDPSNLMLDQCTLEVKGVSWQQIGQQASLIGQSIKVFGGMKPGLPLATYQSQHSGLLVEGEIFKCWGNWVGTEMSIGMTIITGGTSSSGGSEPQAGQAASPEASAVGAGTAPMSARYNRTGPRSIDRRPLPRVAGQANGPSVGGSITSSIGNFGGFGGMVDSAFGDATQTVGDTALSLFAGQGGLVWPINFIHNLQPNMPLSQAIQETLGKAFPKANLNINISPLLKLGYQDAGMYQSFSQYAKYVKDLSHSLLGTNGYLGVNMTAKGNTINVWDGTNRGDVTEISALDLVGQPTWVDIGMVHIMCVLRGDLSSPDLIHLPGGILWSVEPASPFTTQKNQLSFTGIFRILKVQHVGDFRNPDGVQWVTNYECQQLSADEAVHVTNAQNAATVNQTQSATPPPFNPNAPGISVPGAQPSRLLTRAVRKY